MVGRVTTKVLIAAALVPLLLAVCQAESPLGDFAMGDVPQRFRNKVADAERLVGDVRSAQASAAAGTLNAEGLAKAVDSAKASARKILQSRPSDPYVLNSVARLHLQAGLGGPRMSGGDVREGLAFAQQAVTEAGRSGDRTALKLALRTRGVGRYYAEDYPPAEADADRLLAMDPKDPVGGSLKRLIAGRSGPVGALAGEPGERAKGPGPGAVGSAGATDVPAVAGSSGPGADEDDWAPRGPDGKPLSAEGAKAFAARLARTEELLRRGEHAAAREEATQSLMEFGDNPRAYRQRAEALRGLKLYREAAADATHGLELRPGAWHLLVQRAMAYNEAGRFTDALDDADAAAKGKPDSAEAWLVRALARRSLGEQPESYLPDFERAAQLEPQYRRLYVEASELVEALKKRQADDAALPGFLKKPPPLWLSASVGLYLLVALALFLRDRLKS